jgi:putative glutamine amidotransferase
MRPLVAVTTSLDHARGGDGQPSVFLYTSYIDALENLGMTAILLTPAHTKASIEAILEKCSGLLLSGGADVDPARYGEEPSPALGTVQPERDSMEFTALDRALQLDMPVFAICRGMQVLNVHLGGTLYQDLATEYDGQQSHEQSSGWSSKSHDISVVSETQLHEIVGAATFCSNSFHHQAVKAVAPGLRVTARTADGLVEGVESESHAWVVGVQWHPERQDPKAAETDADRRLFAAFRNAVMNRAQNL